MSIDNNSQAAKNFYKAVRTFAIRTKPWQAGVFHDVLPDEQRDITLVSQRVYGNRYEFLAVMAAAGINTFDQVVPLGTLVLPTPAQLYYLKRQAGFESIPAQRANFAPTWIS